MAVAAVRSVEGKIILRAGLALVSGYFEGRIHKQVVGCSDAVRQNTDKNGDAVGTLSVVDFVLLHDFRFLGKRSVGIGDEADVGGEGKSYVTDLLENDRSIVGGGR